MKLTLLIAANVVLIASLMFTDHAALIVNLRSATENYNQKIQAFLYEKTINIDGNKRLSEADISKLLPLDKSVSWWLLNGNEVEEKLTINPLILKAKVSTCSYIDWGCFTVKIKERKPEFIALIGDKPWILGEDGGFISPLDSALDAKSSIRVGSDELKKSIVIKGLLEKNYSPDVLRAKIEFLSSAMNLIEKKVKLQVKEAEVNSDSEVALKFNGHEFPVRFTYDDVSLAKIEDQCLRLKKIFSEFAGRSSEIREVDLAFDHIAVVKKVQEKKPDTKKEKA